MRDILLAKLAKRGVDVRFLDLSAKSRRSAATRSSRRCRSRPASTATPAKKIQTLVKQSKLKVQAAIQGDAVRVTGAKRDDLQAAIALLRKEMADLPLSFNNFRD